MTFARSWVGGGAGIWNGSRSATHACAWLSDVVTDTWNKQQGCSRELGLVLSQHCASPPASENL